MANKGALEVIYKGQSDWILWNQQFVAYVDRAGLWDYLKPEGAEPWPTKPVKPLFNQLCGRYLTIGPALLQKRRVAQSHVLSNGGTKTPKTKRKARHGVKALKEIMAFQKSTQLLIPFAPFSHLVKEVTHDTLVMEGFRW
ncbi:hypothetical protein B0T25DRAFT_562724 [Lasiosphaeria hispida]|uniref:Uncharacterized protein n=1 Tax=Lasiosphaeria hispida TaxID=260671 RepID=A0AAJ0MKF0_9PEZI|nr:hypothetical protein B0T25DRAFT_562724 [Lasiosphaeria hispida]